MKTVLLIGASGGIGNATAQLLLSEGYHVIGTYYQHPERVENINAANFTSFFVDLKQIDTMKDLRTKITDLYAVINCSGIVRFEGESIEEDIAIWNETLAVNVSGNYLLAKYFQDALGENGRFIMISSTDSYFGGAITTSYAVSKSGVNSLTKSLSLSMQDKKIRVNAIAPGWVMTKMVEDNGEEFLQKVADINPLKRNAQPIDIANTISFLLSEKADYINGQVLALEGGYTNQDPTLLLEEETK